MVRNLEILGALGLAAAAGLAGAGGVRLELAERDRHVRAGEEISRTVAVWNEEPTTLTLHLAWRMAIAEAPLGQGSMMLTAPPGASRPAAIRLRFPASRRSVTVRVGLRATAATGQTAWLETAWRIYPAGLDLPWTFLRQRRIGVLDPGGHLRARLAALGAEPSILFNLEEAVKFRGDLLLIGEGVIRPPAAGSALRRLHCRSGGSLLLLHQDGYPADWTGGAQGAGAVRITAAGHPLFRDFVPEDLAGWRGGPVARPPWLAPPAGSFRHLLRPAGGDGAGAALLEEKLPSGGVTLLCQVPLLERWEAEPACEMLLNALLRRGVAGWRPRR